jgi:anti-sigma factor RsiW
VNCEEIRTELVALQDGELPEGSRAEVERHLQGCPSCRAEQEALRALGATLARAPVSAPGTELREQIWARLEGERDPGLAARLRAFFGRPIPILVASASLAAIAAIVVLLGRSAAPPVSPVDATIAGHLELFTDFEAIEQLDVLEDLEFIESLGEDA